MKKHLTTPLIAITALLFSAAGAAAQKNGTVDMKKVFDNYYKTKDAETKNNEIRAAAKRELDEKAEALKTQEQELAKMQDELKKPEISNAKKEEMAKVFQKKFAEYQQEARKLRELEQEKAKQIQENNGRIVKGIVDEIRLVISERVKAEGYDIVFDSSGISANGVPVVLYAKETYDFTPWVVEKLNANKPKGAPAEEKPEEKPAEKPAPKKTK